MIENYKCPGCGASLVYEEGSEYLVCPYCNTRVPIAGLKDKDAQKPRENVQQETGGSAGGDSWAGEESSAQEDGETSHFQCSNCGGELVTDAYTAATVCPFCGSPSMIRSRLEGRDKPDVLIPFAINKEDAAKRFREWTKSGLFTPSGFYRQSTLDGINGVYVPYWLFDFDASVHMDAQATRVRSERKGDYEYTYTDHFLLTRDTGMSFERIPNDASKKMPDDTMERLEPFDYGKMTEFEMPYLSGYLAERTNFEPEELEPRARERAGQYAEQATRDTMEGYTTITVTSSNVRIKKKKQEYAMLPVWVLTYRYRGKNWQLYINGQTGRRIGSLPVDPKKAAVCYAVCSAAVFVLAALIGRFLL